LPMNISEPHLRGASTSGRCSAAESGHEADRCRSEPHPVLPWALFPFEVLPSCRRASRAVDRGALRRKNPKMTACRKTSSVPHPSRSVRDDPGYLLAEATRGRHIAVIPKDRRSSPGSRPMRSEELTSRVHPHRGEAADASFPGSPPVPKDG
jgi:hypothetical protein